MTDYELPDIRTWNVVNVQLRPDLSSLALITIDMQRDTLDGQPFEIPGTTTLLPRLSRLVAAFRTHGLPIVHIVRLYKADGSNAEPCRRHMIQQGVPLLRPETEGSELAEALLPVSGIRLNPTQLLAGGIQQLQAGEVAIYKPRWGAFFGTPLDEYLRALKVNSLAIAGCNFPNCPRTSIYEASERDFRVILVVDAVSGIYERGVAELQGIGVVALKTDELIDALEASRSGQKNLRG